MVEAGWNVIQPILTSGTLCPARGFPELWRQAQIGFTYRGGRFAGTRWAARGGAIGEEEVDSTRGRIAAPDKTGIIT